ncbi:MAG TPA: cytochrome c [Candidatus Deferrimicrobiaceae bacterium]
MRKMRWAVPVSAVLCLALSAAFAAEDGKALFESKCTLCHAASRALSASKDKAEWEATIARMKDKGARVTDPEAQAIASYLVKATGK